MSAAIILATGPSLNAENIKLFQNYPWYAVNDAYRLAPNAAHLVAFDELWWDHHFDHIKHTHAYSARTLWTQSQPAAARYQLNCVKLPKPGAYHPGNSPLLAAYIALSRHLCTTLVFLGLDLSDERGEHFFGPHPDKLRRPHKFHKDILQFERVHALWRANGVYAINATPDTALTCMPVMTPEEALKCLQTVK